MSFYVYIWNNYPNLISSITEPTHSVEAVECLSYFISIIMIHMLLWLLFGNGQAKFRTGWSGLLVKNQRKRKSVYVCKRRRKGGPPKVTVMPWVYSGLSRAQILFPLSHKMLKQKNARSKFRFWCYDFWSTMQRSDSTKYLSDARVDEPKFSFFSENTRALELPSSLSWCRHCIKKNFLRHNEAFA
jgi:hypothetical protein